MWGGPEFFVVVKGWTSFFSLGQRGGDQNFSKKKNRFLNAGKGGTRKDWRPVITNRWSSPPSKNDGSLTAVYSDVQSLQMNHRLLGIVRV